MKIALCVCGRVGKIQREDMPGLGGAGCVYVDCGDVYCKYTTGAGFLDPAKLSSARVTAIYNWNQLCRRNRKSRFIKLLAQYEH